MFPEELSIKAGSRKNISISFDDKKGIHLKSPKKLKLNADGEIILKSHKRIKIKAQSKILLMKRNSSHKVSLEGEFYFKGNNVIMNGSSRESYAPFTESSGNGTSSANDNINTWESKNDIYATVDTDSNAQGKWVENDGSWYYYYPDGSMATGWNLIGGNWYYLFPGQGSMAWGRTIHGSGSKDDESNVFYLNDDNSDGKMITGNGWIQDNGTGVWYYYSDGEALTDWKEIDGEWYYFYDDGSMAWGRTINGYYVNDDGKWVTSEGWQKEKDNDDNITWYYVNSDGKAATGWKNIDNQWYYFDDDGKMVTGLQNIGNDTYYFQSDGEMATKWEEDSENTWHYFYDNGSMAHDLIVNRYYVDKSGKMVTGTGWDYIDGKWYYLNDGEMETGWIKDGNNWYYLNNDGTMAYDTTVDGYHLGDDGEWVPNEDDSSNSQRTSDVSDNDKIADGSTLKSRMQRLPGEFKEYDPDTGVIFNPYTGEIDNISEQFAKLPGERLYYKIGESKKYFDPAIYDQFVVTNTSITDYRIDTEDSSGFTGYIGGTVSGGLLGSSTLSFNIYFSYNKNTNKWTVSVGSSGGGGFIAGENLEAKAHIGFIDGNENSLNGAAIGSEAITPVVDAQIAVTPDNHHCIEVAAGPGVGLAYQENASYTQTFKLFTVRNFF